ncbi:transcriptional regulator, Fur family [Anaeroglobus geminatus F0357]|jgi:Fur family peroxide stress response transcriptional regulator|uniref:Transcriptional regulator, Fur family n=2 Tax=Anaeroglobus TaxID=156454 RepID=G9YEM2_9FIRM|nr:Fur family transcriptional regulator [Anaeroglobus geminatus]EHM44011.1 transcriptional regulator, Fur family [Anaeroglobus geminatus F0357]
MMDIAEVLRQNGYKVTPQRLAVYAVIEHNPAHPNAEAIYRELQPQYPSMSLATVYKTMEIFAKIGVVNVLQCGEDAHRYDYNTTPHAHIRCTECNQVADVHLDQESLTEAAAEQTGYTVGTVGIAFTGICPACREKKA